MSSALRGLAPREALERLVDEDGPYSPTRRATPWAVGRQVWGPPFPERRQVVCFISLTELMRFSVEFCVVKFSSFWVKI